MVIDLLLNTSIYQTLVTQRKQIQKNNAQTSTKLLHLLDQRINQQQYWTNMIFQISIWLNADNVDVLFTTFVHIYTLV